MEYSENLQPYIDITEALTPMSGGVLSSAVNYWLKNDVTDLSYPRSIIASRFANMPKFTREFLSSSRILEKYSGTSNFDALEAPADNPSTDPYNVRMYGMMQYTRKVLQSDFSLPLVRRSNDRPPKFSPAEIHQHPQFKEFKLHYEPQEFWFDNKLDDKLKQKRLQDREYREFIKYCLYSFAKSLVYSEAIDFYVFVTVAWAMRVPKVELLESRDKDKQFNNYELSNKALHFKMGWSDDFSYKVPVPVYLYLNDDFWAEE